MRMVNWNSRNIPQSRSVPVSLSFLGFFFHGALSASDFSCSLNGFAGAYKKAAALGDDS